MSEKVHGSWGLSFCIATKRIELGDRNALIASKLGLVMVNMGHLAIFKVVQF